MQIDPINTKKNIYILLLIIFLTILYCTQVLEQFNKSSSQAIHCRKNCYAKFVYFW